VLGNLTLAEAMEKKKLATYIHLDDRPRPFVRVLHRYVQC